jgi:hypothetical protein
MLVYPMRILRVWCAVLIAGAALAAQAAESAAGTAVAPTGGSSASAKPELRGVIVTSSEQRFLLSAGGGSHSKWVGVGDDFGDWKVSEYRIKDATLVLKGKGGAVLELTMATTSVLAADSGKATLEDAQKLFESMHMGDMIKKIMDQQQTMVTAQMDRGLQRIKGNATPEELAAFKQQLVDKMWSGVDSQKITDGIAKIYSEEFTADQIKDMADYYSTPTGQATIAKMPEIQAKQQQLIAPQIQAMIPAIAQMQKDFAAEHRVGGVGAAGAAARSADKTP